jgi:uncharacterized protein YndB with AHSA1/START domain
MATWKRCRQRGNPLDANSLQSSISNPRSSQVTLPTDREIVIKRSFDAPRAAVFEAWTKPEHVARWWDPSGRPLAVCEIDLRPNGAFRWVNHAPDGSQGHSFIGIYREISPPEKLVFVVRMLPSSPEPIGTLVFTEDGGKTNLTLTIECATNKDRDALLQMRVDAGTTQTLENLAAYLTKIT